MFLWASHRYYLLLLLMSLAPVAFAQLKISLALSDDLPPSVRKQSPVFIFGDTLSSRPALEVLVEGRAEIRKADTVIRAKRIDYNQVSDTAKLSGEVVVNQGGNRFWGPALELGLSDFSGFFSQPSFQFYKTGGQGSAKHIEFVSQRSVIAKYASYSTCKRPESTDGKPWRPAWILSSDQINFDLEEDIATASGTTLRFQDVPILMIPSFNFPISGARKSGLLAPTFASDNQSGLTVTQPIYWNIAPNRDAVFYPSSIGRRGFNYGGEFRYLEPQSVGTIRADYLPHDDLVGGNRWAYAIDQRQVFRPSVLNTSEVVTTLKLNRVSDDAYWRDFPNSTTALTQRLLNNEFNLTANLNGWSTLARLQRWQTLQGSADAIVPPFDRQQLLTRRSFNFPSGLNFRFETDITEFRSRPELTLQPNGARSYGLVQVARPWLQPGGYVTPSLQWHGTLYHTESSALGADSTRQRSIPTFSLDSGLFFERDIELFSSTYKQTLEPRVFFVRTPYFDQSNLPNYDSAIKDFSLATIYSENSFVGNDRISDMHMLTLGLSSRFLNPMTGAQSLSAGVAQRISFIDQRVTLPNTAVPTSRLSDYLFNASARLHPAWQVDGTVQVGVNSSTAERTTVSTRYAPRPYHSIALAYRMQKGISEQVDVNWQWPIAASAAPSLGAHRWYSLARLNYSVMDSRLVSALAGFEYDADCWIGRLFLEKTQLDASTANQRLMFQIEFSGFSRIGTSPLASLRSNIPQYQNLREQITAPSRFSHYD